MGHKLHFSACCLWGKKKVLVVGDGERACVRGRLFVPHFGEAVADAADGFDHVGIAVEFFTEAAHVGVDGACVDHGFIAPYVVEEDFSA